MCWMTIRRDDSPLASGIDACRAHEAQSGGHSWGYAISDGRKLEIVKQTGRIVAHSATEAEAALVHTRLATRGDITQENAHPFRVSWEEPRGAPKERHAALAHNGTWYEAPVDDRCDSYHMAMELQDRLRDGQSIRDAITATGSLTQETFVVLTDRAECFVHSGRFNITCRTDVVASSGHEPISTGTVVEF